MRRAESASKRYERAVRAIDRHVAHAAAALAAAAVAHHFVVGEQRPIEHNHIRLRQPLHEARRHRSGARHEDETGAAAAQFDADIGAAFLRRLRFAALQIERHLAGHGEKLSFHAHHLERLLQADAVPFHHIARQDGEDRIIGDGAERGRGAVDRKGLALAQMQQSGNLVDLGAGQHDRFDGTAAHLPLRLQHRRRLKLRAQVRRSVQQRPAPAIGRDGKARLRALAHARIALPCQTADGTPAIPLRIAAAGRRAEDDGRQPTHARTGVVRIRTRPASSR